MSIPNRPIDPADRSYTHLDGNHPTPFDPFNPGPAGALREAYAWITQPSRCAKGEMIYDAARYNELTAMMRRAMCWEAA